MANLTKKQQKNKLRPMLLEMGRLALLTAGIVAVLVLINQRTLLAAGESQSGGAARTAMGERAEEAQPEEPSAGEPDETEDAGEAAAAAAEETPLPERSDGLPAVDVNGWSLRLVSSDYLLPSNYEPELVSIEGDERFDARAAQPLKQLIAAARSAGYSVYVCSCYRSYETQSEIYWNHVYEYQLNGMTMEQAEASSRLAVCYPGGSEHQLGLAADLMESADQEMEPWVGGSGLMLWLEQNCAEYGFVIRYPNGKTDVTGVEYEPWHVRYVGREAAAYIMENGLCLEEFLALYED